MNFILKPTLEHIALVHVTATLWNEHDIRFLLTEFLKSPLFLKMDVELSSIPPIFTERKEKWKTIENRVKEKVPQLMIPPTVKEKIVSFIQPIGLQILRWMEYHRTCYCFDLDLPNEFYWTPQGTIDKKKTASVLIKDESINITTRYELACIYCLEYDIHKLWNEMPESHRDYFYNEEDPSRIELEELVVFWTYFIKGEVDRIDKMIKEKYNLKCTSYQYAFKFATDDGNIDATKYFLEKLTSRNKWLVKRAITVAKKRHEIRGIWSSTDTPKEYHTEVLCFLLSQMDEEQQIEVFKKQPFQVLKSFLDWPCQFFFLETARCVWNFLPESLYYNTLLRLITEKVISGYVDYNYQEMFRELWQQIPDTDKSSLIEDNNIVELIFMLLQIKDEKNIKLIFQTASLIEKKNLIFSKRGRFICEDMIHCEEVDLLKYFIQLCFSSKDEIIRFKQDFQEHILRRYSVAGVDRFRNTDKLDIFYKLLDDFACEFDRRKSSNADNSPAKRLCKSLNMYPSCKKPHSENSLVNSSV